MLIDLKKILKILALLNKINRYRLLQLHILIILISNLIKFTGIFFSRQDRYISTHLTCMMNIDLEETPWLYLAFVWQKEMHLCHMTFEFDQEDILEI